MSKPCNKCGGPIEFKQNRGRWIPINADGAEHRETCPAQKGLVPSSLKRTTRHHTSQYKIKRFQECQLQAYFADVLELPEGQSTPEMQAGVLVHGAREFVAVERHKANALDVPATSADYLAALETVVGRESWSLEAVALARSIIHAQVAPVDLSFTLVDEHGPLVERAFELPVGDGVIVGGVVDLVERVEDEVILRDYKSGAWRDPSPESSPQTGLYLAWGRAVFGERVRFSLDYLALGVSDEVFWSPRIEDDAKAAARALVTKTRTKAEDESAWPATYGGACLRCAYTARCPEFKARTAVPSRSAKDPETAEELAAAIHAMRPVANVSDGLVNRWTEKLKRLMADAPTERYEDEGKPKTVARATFGGYPVRLTTYVQAPEKKIREGGVRQRLDVGDPTPRGAGPPAPALASENLAGALPVNPTGAKAPQNRGESIVADAMAGLPPGREGF